MKTSQLLLICQRLFESLDRAAAEGYDNVLLNPADETADEIGEYDAQLADVPTAVLRPLVMAWLAARFGELANTVTIVEVPSAQTTADRRPVVTVEYISAVTGRPVATLGEAVHALLETILCGDLLTTSTPEAVALQLAKHSPTTFFGGMAQTYQELIPHVLSWFEKHNVR
jgi:hypothetical protein